MKKTIKLFESVPPLTREGKSKLFGGNCTQTCTDYTGAGTNGTDCWSSDSVTVVTDCQTGAVLSSSTIQKLTKCEK
jgi:hypothetical protein